MAQLTCKNLQFYLENIIFLDLIQLLRIYLIYLSFKLKIKSKDQSRLKNRNNEETFFTFATLKEFSFFPRPRFVVGFTFRLKWRTANVEF